MKYVYASRTGNVESLIDKLGLDAIKIEDGSEIVDEEFILFTYTDGDGDIPFEVEEFLNANFNNLKGVITSGDTSYGDSYCLAGDKIAENYGVSNLYKLENDGTDDDIININNILSTF